LAAATALALTWLPPLPERVKRTLRPGEGPRLLPVEPAVSPVMLRWRWEGGARPWTAVLFDPQFAEVARLGPTAAGADSVAVPADVLRGLDPAGGYSWLVESADAAPRLRSRLAPLPLPGR